MSELEAKLKARKTEIEAKLKTLDDARITITDQCREGNQKLSQIAQEVLRLQGEMRLLEWSNESNEEKKQQPTPAIPSKKK